jgi:mono/diheme cytochrome c family protein
MRGNFFVGVAIGAGAVLFGPSLWKSGRPAIKGAVRAGIEGYGVARIKAAQFAEEVEDLVAEVAHEMQEAVAEAAPTVEKAVKPKKKGDG